MSKWNIAIRFGSSTLDLANLKHEMDTTWWTVDRYVDKSAYESVLTR